MAVCLIDVYSILDIFMVHSNTNHNRISYSWHRWSICIKVKQKMIILWQQPGSHTQLFLEIFSFFNILPSMRNMKKIIIIDALEKCSTSNRCIPPIQPFGRLSFPLFWVTQIHLMWMAISSRLDHFFLLVLGLNIFDQS